MSFVLDALKRSEQDRSQGQMPNLVDNGSLVHLNGPQRQWWPYVLITVLLINALVFLYIALADEGQSEGASFDMHAQDGLSLPVETASRNKVQASPTIAISAKDTVTAGNTLGTQKPSTVSAEPVTAVVESTQAVETKDAGLARQQKGEGDIDWAERERRAKDLITAHKAQERSYASLDDQPVRIDPRPRQSESEESSADSISGYETISPKATPRGGALAFPTVAAPAAEPEDQAENQEVVSTSLYADVLFLYEQDSSSRPRVPNLRFNSHIYSESPSARRVMINNIYLREGQQFLGMEVIEIGEFNIVFKKDGELFKLPAMRDWNG